MKGTNNSVLVQKTIGSRISAARKSAKLSRIQFAEQLLQHEAFPEIAPRKGANEITTPTEKLANKIKQWERGENTIDIECIPAICAVLNCDVGYLFGEYEEHYHVAADISAFTGLSEININRLIIWQDRFSAHFQNIANVSIEAAFRSLDDYLHLDMARISFEKFINTGGNIEMESPEHLEKYKEVLHFWQTEDQANQQGYTMLKNKDAIRFYARSIANTLEQYLEEVYTNGIY